MLQNFSGHHEIQSDRKPMRMAIGHFSDPYCVAGNPSYSPGRGRSGSCPHRGAGTRSSCWPSAASTRANPGRPVCGQTPGRPCAISGLDRRCRRRISSSRRRWDRPCAGGKNRAESNPEQGFWQAILTGAVGFPGVWVQNLQEILHRKSARLGARFRYYVEPISVPQLRRAPPRSHVEARRSSSRSSSADEDRPR